MSPDETSEPMHDEPDSAPLASDRCKAMSKRSGVQCRNRPMTGLEVCRMHGVTRAARAKGARVVAQRAALDAVRRLGTPVEVDPTQALLDALYSARGDLQFWAEVSSALELRHGNLDGEAASIVEGILGVNHLGDQAVHVAVTQLGDAQRRVAQISKWCIDANIGERRMQLVEAEVAGWFSKIIAALQKLGLDTPEVRVAIAAELRGARADAIDVESEEL